MIDYMSLKAPLKTKPEEVVRLLNKTTGETEEFPQRKVLVGKDGKTEVVCSFVNGGTAIRLSGNALKYLTGQNVIGTTNVQTLGYTFLVKVCRDLGITPTDQELAQWKRG